MSSAEGLGIGKLAVIGAGNIAYAVVKGAVQGGLVPAAALAVSSPSGPSVKFQELGVQCGVDNVKCAAGADMLIFAVKPPMMAAAIASVRDSIRPDTLIISVAAGVSIETIEKVGGVRAGQGSLMSAEGRRLLTIISAMFSPIHPPLQELNRADHSAGVIRVMPNTPCGISQGASAFCCSSKVGKPQKEAVQRLLQAMGTAVEVKENQMDAVTGLSGSGPAFVFMFMEALADGGVAAGLPRAVAMQLAAATVKGSAALQELQGSHPGQLKDNVASPGGTTIAGIMALEKGAFRGTVMSAVVAATERAAQMREAAAAASVAAAGGAGRKY